MAKTGPSKPRAKPRALVTGGAGFVGSHLCERLLSEGYRVVCMDNLIEGTWRLMKSSEARPVNIGNPQEHTVGEIAELVIELSGGDILHEPLPEDDPRRRCPDITRARETLGWEPCVSAREGLKKTLDWFAGRSSRHEVSPARR